MQSILVVTDVSGRPSGPKFKGQAMDFLTLKMGPTGCTETSITNYQFTPRNIPGERRQQKSKITQVV
jgi:hypothetical protein